MTAEIAKTIVVLAGLAIPLGLSGWALLDAARCPRWVWAFSGRRQVLWMSAIAIGVATVIGGLIVSTYYLTHVRPRLKDIEAGNLGD